MTPEQLNYLLVLQEEQNLSRAAARLYITQPTLTAYINRLEKNLGVELFDRHHSPVLPTPCGMRYIERMKELVYAELQLSNDLRDMNEQRQKLCIGIGHAHSTTLLPWVTECFLTRHPDVDISIHESQEKVLLNMLARGEIDLFFGHADMESSHMQYGVLYKERNLLLMPASFFAGTAHENERSTEAHPIVLEPELLRTIPAIIPGTTQGSYITLMSSLTAYHIKPPRIISTRNMFTAARMAARGLGYCYGNRSLVDLLPASERRNISYCILPNMNRTRPYYYSYDKDSPNAALLAEFAELVRESFDTI